MGNREVVESLEVWLRELGFKTEIQAIEGHPGKYNLIASAGSGPEGLVLAGHTDTVPFDEALWRSDPLKLTERAGRLHGLGATDMKGFFALAIEAARAFQAGDLREPLTIVATADEESSIQVHDPAEVGPMEGCTDF